MNEAVAGVIVTKDVYYDEHTNRCDIYSQQKCKDVEVRTALPVVIIVHGGAWIFGCKEEMSDIAHFLTNQNHVCVSIEYALSQLDKTIIQMIIVSVLLVTLLLCYFIHHKCIRGSLIFLCLFIGVYSILKLLCHENRTTQHPDHVMDVSKAIEWVYHNCHQYGGNPNQISILGHSSGAHLASLVTLNPRFLAVRDVPSNVIKSVIAISGPYSYWRMQQSSVKHFINQNVFAVQETMDPSSLDAIKPDGSKDKLYTQWANIVDAWPIFFEHTISPLSTPPFLLLTAGVDWSLLYHARDFADMIKRQKGHVQVIHFPNTTHFSIRAHWNNSNHDVGSVVNQFLQVVNE